MTNERIIINRLKALNADKDAVKENLQKAIKKGDQEMIKYLEGQWENICDEIRRQFDHADGKPKKRKEVLPYSESEILEMIDKGVIPMQETANVNNLKSEKK